MLFSLIMFCILGKSKKWCMPTSKQASRIKHTNQQFLGLKKKKISFAFIYLWSGCGTNKPRRKSAFPIPTGNSYWEFLKRCRKMPNLRQWILGLRFHCSALSYPGMMELLVLSFRLSSASLQRRLQLLVFRTLFCHHLLSRDHRWGSYCRWTSELRTLLFSSALSSPR